MSTIPVSASLPRYEELINSEKHLHVAYPTTTSPSIHELPPSLSTQAYEHNHSHAGGCPHCNGCRKTSRTRRFLAPILFTIVTIGSLIIVGCMGGALGYLPAWHSSLGSPSSSEPGSGVAEGFVRRAVVAMNQVADPGSGQSGGGVFIDRKCASILLH